MANELETVIVRTLHDCADAIRANMQAQNINASGRTSESIRVRDMGGDGYQLVAGRDGDHTIEAGLEIITQRDTAPFPTVEIGRPGGNVPKGFYYIIREWTREKGLQFSSETERGTFAYFTARKIAREGTKRNQENADVYSTQATECANAIREACKKYLKDTIRAATGGFSITTSTN